MTNGTTTELDNHREELLPVVLKIFALYVGILTTGYFLGNFIYQIP